MNTIKNSIHVLSWARDPSGRKNQAINKKFDTCDRLGMLLMQSTQTAFLQLLYGQSMINTRSVYNVPGVSFLKTIRDGLLQEITDLLEDPIVNQNNSSLDFRVSTSEILSNRMEIIELCQSLLSFNRNTLGYHNLNTYDFFDMGLGTGFYKEFAQYIYNNMHEQESVGSYISLPFTMPMLYRNGFSVSFEFNENITTSILSYSINGRIASMYDFLSGVTFVNQNNTDSYLRVFGSYAMTNQINSTGNNRDHNLFAGISNAFTNTSIIHRVLGRIMQNICNKSIVDAGQDVGIGLIIMVANILDRTDCVIGPVSSTLVSSISHRYFEGLSNNVKSLVVNILKTDNNINIMDSSEEGYVESFDKNSIYFKEVENGWLSFEGLDDELEALGDDEDEPEDKDSNDDPDKKQDDSTKDLDNPNVDPDEGSEPDDNTPVKKVEVRVPKNSYLINLDMESESFDEYIYKTEVFNLIIRIVDNPPEDMVPEDLLLLEQFAKKLLFITDVKTIKELVEDIIKVVPNCPEDKSK